MPQIDAQLPHWPDVMAAGCPSRPILNHLTARWSVYVLIALQQNGVMRFSQLRRHIGGISERMLAQTLQQLENDGFVLRHAHQVVPPHVDYQLTDLGQEAARHVAGLVAWIEHSLPRILLAQKAQKTQNG